MGHTILLNGPVYGSVIYIRSCYSVTNLTYLETTVKVMEMYVVKLNESEECHVRSLGTGCVHA